MFKRIKEYVIPEEEQLIADESLEEGYESDDEEGSASPKKIKKEEKVIESYSKMNKKRDRDEEQDMR